MSSNTLKYCYKVVILFQSFLVITLFKMYHEVMYKLDNIDLKIRVSSKLLQGYPQRMRL